MCRNDEFLGGEVPKAILVVVLKAKKSAFDASVVQLLLLRVNIVRVCYAPEDTSTRQVWLSAIHQFEGCFITMPWTPVFQVSNVGNSLPPLIRRHSTVTKNRTGSLEEGAKAPLDYPILIRIVWCCRIPLDAIVLQNL